MTSQGLSGNLFTLELTEPQLTFFFFFWPHPAACGILVLLPRIEPASPALEVQSLKQ